MQLAANERSPGLSNGDASISSAASGCTLQRKDLSSDAASGTAVPGVLSNRAARLEARRSTANYLLSIGLDSRFVIAARAQVGASDLPLLANLRAGSWYVPPESLDGTCYFKSVDGHKNEWDFSLIRLNLQVARLAASHGGVVLVDCTGNRRKTLPDSLSKTVPIWCAVLQSVVSGTEEKYLEKHLHLPECVPLAERQEISSRLLRWSAKLKNALPSREILELAQALCGAELRTLWLCPEDNIEEVAARLSDLQQAGHAVILCISASRAQATGCSSYVQGAGDDEESWAGKLTPQLFWDHASELLDIARRSPHELDALIASKRSTSLTGVVAKVNPVGSSVDISQRDGVIGNCCFIGETGLAVGDFAAAAPPGVWAQFDAVLNCGGEEHPGMRGDSRYIMLPAADEKKADAHKRWWQDWLLPRALRFLLQNLNAGRKVLIHCTRGDNRAPAVAAAALAAFFGPDSSFLGFPEHKGVPRRELSKLDLRKCLVTIQCHHPYCVVPRRIMQFLNLFFVTDDGGWSSWSLSEGEVEPDEAWAFTATPPSRGNREAPDAEERAKAWRADEVLPRRREKEKTTSIGCPAKRNPPHRPTY
ncbi:unnamed protein product [Polarella glacialis]|uniref:Uncharacterized protein n=1 Tax=Polarella glacialis TaxID=89957 RepID=A0A813JDH4_POLGL|nr:unnamed protein product [Polarella glacialis]